MKRGHFALFHRSTIAVGDEPYLIRWRIVQTPWFAVYLHHILRSDDGWRSWRAVSRAAAGVKF